MLICKYRRSFLFTLILDRASLTELETITEYVEQRKSWLLRAEKLKEEKMVELVKQFPPNEQHSYIIDLKSVLMQKSEFQGLWPKLKPIQGDPLIAIVDNEKVINFGRLEEV